MKTEIMLHVRSAGSVVRKEGAREMVTLLDALGRAEPLIMADGGARSVSCGQNSLGALDAAIAAQADLVALDVRRCRDGEFVVFRDPGLARMTAATGVLSAMSSSSVTRLQLRSGSGSCGAGLTQDYVPLLTEALAQARDRVPLVLRVLRWADAEAIAAMVAALGLADSVALCLPVTSVVQVGRALSLREDYGVLVAAMVSIDARTKALDAELILSLEPLLVHLRRNSFWDAPHFRDRLRRAGTPISVQSDAGCRPVTRAGSRSDCDSAARWGRMIDLGARILVSPQPRSVVQWRENRKAA